VIEKEIKLRKDENMKKRMKNPQRLFSGATSGIKWISYM